MRGRPRRFDDVTERGILLDAGFRLLRARGYGALSVSDVLAAAGVSTRSFYRHFDSKEALLRALLDREVEAVANYLGDATQGTSDPVSAVEAWIDRFLDTFFDPRRAARSGLFTTPAVLAAFPLASEHRAIRSKLCRSLADALREGHATGVLVSEDAEGDAMRIFGLVTASVVGPGSSRKQRDAVRSQVLRFSWPALRVVSRGG